jgi:peroxiredoxin
MELDFDVLDIGDPDHPREGETAPDFTRPLVGDDYWEDATLADLTAEGPVLLVFYPMNGSFPATYIWNELRDRGVHEGDTAVVGLSVSTPYAHRRFMEDHGLDGTGVRLFSDPQNGVARQYGIVNDLDGMGGVAEHRPATFVLDEERTVQHAWAASEWPAFPDYDALEAALDG